MTTAQPPQLQIETITPDIAQQMLELNVHNRSIRSERINMYAESMKSGQWLLTGEPIIINGTTLINGQHRLHACIKANVPFVTAVFRNAESDVYTVVDSGLPRQVSDVLRQHEFTDVTELGAALKLVIGYRHNQLQDPKALRITASKQNSLDFALENRQKIEMAINITRPSRQNGFRFSSAIAATVLLFDIIGDDETEEWVGRALSGIGLPDGDARLALRRWSVNAAKQNHLTHLSAWIRARNAHHLRENRTIIKAWAPGIPFPSFVEG